MTRLAKYPLYGYTLAEQIEFRYINFEKILFFTATLIAYFWNMNEFPDVVIRGLRWIAFQYIYVVYSLRCNMTHVRLY